MRLTQKPLDMPAYFILFGLFGLVLLGVVLGSVALGMRNSKTTGQTLASPVLLHPVAGRLGSARTTVTGSPNVTLASLSDKSNDTSGVINGVITLGAPGPTIGDFYLNVKFGTPYAANAAYQPQAVVLTVASGVPISYLSVFSLDNLGFIVKGNVSDSMNANPPLALCYYHVL